MIRRHVHRWLARRAYRRGVLDARADAHRRTLAILEQVRP